MRALTGCHPGVLLPATIRVSLGELNSCVIKRELAQDWFYSQMRVSPIRVCGLGGVRTSSTSEPRFAFKAKAPKRTRFFGAMAPKEPKSIRAGEKGPASIC